MWKRSRQSFTYAPGRILYRPWPCTYQLTHVITHTYFCLQASTQTPSCNPMNSHRCAQTHTCTHMTSHVNPYECAYEAATALMSRNAAKLATSRGGQWRSFLNHARSLYLHIHNPHQHNHHHHPPPPSHTHAHAHAYTPMHACMHACTRSNTQKQIHTHKITHARTNKLTQARR